jgi:Protein of unknown function (DUF3710)
VFRRHRREDADRSRHDSGADQGQQDFDDELAEGDELDDELADDELAADHELAEPDDGPEQAKPGGPGRPAAARRGEDLGDPATWTRLRDSAATAGSGRDRAAGPWDAAAGYPDGERMDFGSLLVPLRDGFDIQVSLEQEPGIWIAVVYGNSAIQLQAFAAPKTTGLWEEVRQEIAAEAAKSGGQSEEGDGPFGPEILVRLSQGPASQSTGGQPGVEALRFMGADGPRWFLRGLISGPAAQQPELAQPFEEIFADVVVVRGDHAQPPRQPLDIQLPEEARQAIEQQMEAEGDGMPNPFERGPEITETR